MFTILIIIALGAVAALSVLRGFDQFALLAFTAGTYLFVDEFIWTISPSWVGAWFWLIWFIAFVTALIAYARNGMRVAVAAAIFGIVAVTFGGLVPSLTAKNDVTAQAVESEVASEAADAQTALLVRAPALEATTADDVATGTPAQLVLSALAESGISYTLDVDRGWALESQSSGVARYGDPILSSSEMVEAIAADTPEARSLVEEAKKYFASHGIDLQVENLYDADNWVVAQALETIEWPENSGFVDGDNIPTGSRVDQAGSVGIFYGGPELPNDGSLKPMAYRGHCGANPQGAVPQKPSRKPAEPPTTPPVTETTPPVTETTPPVTETTPPVTETTPPVTETTPPVTTPPCPYIPEIPEDHPDCKEKEGEEAPDPVEGHDGPHGDPPGEPETEQPEQPAPADPSVAPGSPDPSIEVPPAEETTEETEEQAEPAPTSTQGPTHEPTRSAEPVEPEVTEDPEPEVTPTTDPEPPPFGDSTDVDANDVAGAAAAAGLLIPLMRRKRLH